MSPTRTVRLVAEREIRDRLGNKAFIGSTLVTVLALVAIVVLPAVLGGETDEGRQLGVVGAVDDTFRAGLDVIGAAQDEPIELVELPDRDAAVAAIEAGDVDAALLVDDGQLLADGPPPGTLTAALDAARQQAAVAGALEDAGLDDQQLQAVLTPVAPLQVVDLEGEATDDGFFDAGVLFASVATVLLFFIVQLNAASLMSVALEEKTNRVVEVLVAAARPWQLLGGKVLAMTVLALGQFALFVGAGLGANAAVDAFPLPDVAGGIIAITALMLVVGFLFYAALFAVAGSMASSVEDSQATSTPLIMFLVASYVITFISVLPAPDGVLANVLTFLPPTAPFVVPARFALGELPVWQLVGSVLVTGLGAYGAVRLAGRLYAAALLAGGKLTWRGAWRAEPVR